jgi:hypothetical protein
MPWAVRKQRQGDKIVYRVIKSDSGEIAKNGAGTAVDGGGHASKDKAAAQVRALYNSESGRKYK